MQLEDERQSSDDEDEDKYVDKMDMIGTKVDAAERYTVRNLRIREDTAKYLRNLDPNSAHYDPKTRSMRKNPYEHSGKAEDEVRFVTILSSWNWNIPSVARFPSPNPGSKP